MCAKIIFNRSKIIEGIIKKHNKLTLKKLSWPEKSDYFYNRDRINNIIAYHYFSTFRGTIDKKVSEMYLNNSIEDISNSIIFFDTNCVNSFYIGKELCYISDDEVLPLVTTYVKKRVAEIESKTLFLEL